MALEERVAYLEGKVSEQSQAFVSLHDAMGRLEHRIDVRFEAVDRRFEAIDRRFEAIDRRFEALDEKISRHFTWTVGIQITTLIAIVGALISRG